MSIQIIDNFQLNQATPIDNRFVVGTNSFYTTRDSIPYKYPGMRIWDLNDSIPYVWTGTTYSSENNVAVTGNGTVARIPKFTLTTVLGDSLITDSGTNVGIGYANETLASEKLSVNGNIRTDGVVGFIGLGGSITQINASNIATGTMSINRIQNDSTNKILMTGATVPQWVSANNVSVGTASTIAVVNDAASATTHYVSFFSTTSGGVNKISSTKLTFIPSTGNFYVSGNVGVGYSSPGNKLSVNGTFTVGSNVALTGGTNRVWFNSASIGSTYNNGALQVGANKEFEFFTGDCMFSIYNPSGGGGTNRLSFQNFSSYSVYHIRNTHYINTPSSSGYISFGHSGLNDQFRMYMSGNSLPVFGGGGFYVDGKTYLNGRTHIGGGLSTGIGSLIKAVYVIHTEVRRNGAAPLSTTGFDYLGNAVTYTHISYSSNSTVTFRLNLPTAFPTTAGNVPTTVFCVANCDNANSYGNDYKFQVLVRDKTTSSLTITVVAPNINSLNWSDDNPVGITVVAYCI